MKLQIFSIIAILIFSGCTSNDSLINQENVSVGAYFDFKILAFQGLEYVGLIDDYETFYANNDSSFAIYVENFIYSAESFENAKQIFSENFNTYENFECFEVSSSGWLTNAQVLECSYRSSEFNTSYKSTIFYKNNEFIHTMLSVWGSDLNNYESIFDEFNKKAIQWE